MHGNTQIYPMIKHRVFTYHFPNVSMIIKEYALLHRIPYSCQKFHHVFNQDYAINPITCHRIAFFAVVYNVCDTPLNPLKV